jgi:hypothetical protein
MAQARGLLVSYKTLDDDLSGFLLRGGDRTIIGVNVAHPIERQRFTIAHELGHALLHEGDELHVDHGFSVNFRSPRSLEGTRVEEKALRRQQHRHELPADEPPSAGLPLGGVRIGQYAFSAEGERRDVRSCERPSWETRR